MDELVHHCLRELAFDGDLGCHPSRLRDFVASYYSDPSCQQVVDDAYFAFVWSLVVCQPTVRVGTVPDGASEVYIAPQQSQKRKSKGKEKDQDQRGDTLSSLTLPDARSRTLEDLRLQYGEALRVAVDAETSFAAIIGSHIRPSKLTPMVYTALQFITRGREHGISTVDLGKKTGYDQKTCFYLIKQLLELELVVKLRRGGVGTNFCVHKYFFERSPLWRQIQDEGVSSSKDIQEADMGGLDNEETASTQDGFQAPVQFDPIDARHLSSLSLIQSRIVKLLKHSESHTHPSNNVLVTIGFLNPTKTDRRFFQSRLRELIENRVVERVMVPSAIRSGPASVPCIRLISNNDDAANQPGETHITGEPSTHVAPEGQPTTLKLNITLHKQIIDLLTNAGTKGMTLSEISAELGNFDRRTLELLLSKMDKVPPPTHLSDLRIIPLMETHGRERRWRYFTFASYREIIANEKLDDQDGPYSSVDFSNVGNFAPFVAEDFYGDVVELNRLMDYTFSKTGKMATPATGKKRKRGEAGLDTLVDHTPRKRGRPRKHAVEGANVSEKSATTRRDRGRSCPEESIQPEGTIISNDLHTSPPKVPRKRRRLPDDNHGGEFVPEASVAPRRRGRPRKQPPSCPPTDETGHPLQNVINSSDVHMAHHLISEPPPPPPNVNVREAEARSTLNESGTALQYPELLIQPDLTSSTIYDHRPVGDPGMGMGIIDDNQLRPAQPVDPNTDPKPTGMEGPRELDVEGGTLVRMDICSEPSVSIDAPSAPQKPKENSRSNVSLLRRESEFLRILEESRGIVHLGSKEFLDAHMALLDTLASAGEPTSGLPGLKIDKRTIESTFESLENRGKVKVLKTAIFTVTGAQRPARIVYLPTVAQPQLDTFLAELGKSPHGTPYSVTGSVAASIPPGDLKTKRPAQPLRLLQSERGVENIGRWARSSDTADQLFQSDDQTIHDVLLTERTTLAQLYGFIPGKMMRARQLHLATLDTFDPCHDSPTPALAAKRVVKFSQYFRSFPVGVYCSIVSTLVQSDKLSQILSTEEGRRTLVKDLPQSLQTLLQIGRPRSRERLLDLFEILHHLNLVTPLQPSDSPNPHIRCESNGEGPSSFDTFEGDLSSTNYRTAPDFWLFHDDAALYLWALSTASPPFWKTVSVSNRLDASNCWNELQSACESKAFAQTVTRDSPSRPVVPDYSFARAVIRDASWNRMYDLSWHQRQYLKRFISRRRGDVSLQGEEDGPFLEKVSWTISAPLSVVKDFLQKEQASQLRELDKARLRTPGNQGDEEHAEKFAQEKELLAKKVADSKARKEREWEAILNAVHAGELEGAAVTRVVRVRKRYLQSGVASDRSRWEDEVRDAIRGLAGYAEAVLLSAQRVAPTRPLQGLPSNPVAIPPPEATASMLCHAGLPPIVANQPRKSIEQLITEQGPAREEARKAKRKQKKSEDGTEEGNGEDDDQSQRKSRFLWNKEYDELVQDAHAILRVRLRDVGGRMDWFALRQVFPAVPRNSLRQRIASLKELQSNEVYMRRLEDQWYRLWKQYQSTEHLPDLNPQSQTDFDLIKHLEFLRKFVDKNALYVLCHILLHMKADMGPQAGRFPRNINGSDCCRSRSLNYTRCGTFCPKPDNTPVWEFLWDSKVDENRERGLLQTALTTNLDDIPLACGGPNNSQEVQVAEAALKMVFGTPNENYMPSRGAALLRSVGEGAVSKAKDNLLSRGVLSKVVKDPQRPRPGRTLKISEINQNALGGSIPQEVFHDATTLDALYQQEAWREWPLRASDGDLAMLAQITSEGLVDFKLDITGPRTARTEIDWNSKRADDDHIETTIYTRSRLSGVSTLDTEDVEAKRTCTPSAVEDGDEGHGKTIEGAAACCRKCSNGQVNCDLCLNTALKAWVVQSGSKEQEVPRRVLAVLDEAGPAGLHISTLITNTVGAGGNAETALAALASLMDNPIPLVVPVGHSQPLVVDARQAVAWTVTVSEEPRINVFPRRWLDVKGGKVRETWRAAMRAVTGILVFRPGISQAELVWRLRSVYDRAEVVDVLRQLSEDGFVRGRLRSNKQIGELGLVAVREEEEREEYWFLGDQRWYQTGM
ncbi:hypothetical protein F5888DRAFT_45373 [Russula emetica]|nr:hypothetical protein F5888DRAFT_45373 [Russula emetica]